MALRGRSGFALLAVIAVLAVAQDDAPDPLEAQVDANGQIPTEAVLAEISQLSEGLEHLFDEKKRKEIRAVIGGAMGEWRTDPVLEKTIKDVGACTLRKLGGKDYMTREFFESLTEPVVFRSKEVDKWKCLTRPWTRSWLRDTYGRSKIMPRSPQVLSHSVLNRKDTGGVLDLKDFCIMNTNRSIFERSSITNLTEFEDEEDLLLVDELLDDEEYGIPTFLENHTELKGLALGPSGSGFPFHQGGELWQAQIVGKKLWMLHPPRGLPQDWEIASPRNVVKQALTKEGCPKMQHCLLEPGEVIFVPRYWYHGTMNVGDSVGFGGDRDVWNPDRVTDGEVMAVADKEREEKEKNVLAIDMAAVREAGNKSWKAALKDGKLAHISRPGCPYTARRFAELLLAVKKNTSAAQVVDKYINRTLTLHQKGWMDAQEMSGILTLVAYPLIANSFGMDVDRLVPKSLSLVKKAAKMDPNNWSARIMAAHNYLLMANLEMSFELLHGIPTRSMGFGPAASLLEEMCFDMPDEYSHLATKYCPKDTWKETWGKEADKEKM